MCINNINLNLIIILNVIENRKSGEAKRKAYKIFSVDSCTESNVSEDTAAAL